MARDPRIDPQPGDEFESHLGMRRVTVRNGSTVYFELHVKNVAKYMSRVVPLSGWQDMADFWKVKVKP